MLFALADKDPDFWTVTLPAMIGAAITAVVTVVVAATAGIRIVVKAIRELKADVKVNTDLTKEGVEKVKDIKSDTTETKELASGAKKDAVLAVGISRSAKADATDAKVLATERNDTVLTTLGAVDQKMNVVLENVNGKATKNEAMAHEAGVAKGQRDLLLETANSHGERLTFLESRMGKIETVSEDTRTRIGNLEVLGEQILSAVRKK